MESLNVINLYFVTGTDTGAGKTMTSIALLQAAQRKGYTTAAYKPISAGNEMFHKQKFKNNDVLMLQKNSTLFLSDGEINPYNFLESTSIHIVSTEEKKPIDFSILSNGLNKLKQKANWIVIEGVGGWFSPISERKTLADWVFLEKIPVILVVNIKLGCINHATLTSHAIMCSGSHLVGWIANNTQIPEKRYDEYIEILRLLLKVPLIGEIPWLGKNINYSNIGDYLDLDRLVFSCF